MPSPPRASRRAAKDTAVPAPKNPPSLGTLAAAAGRFSLLRRGDAQALPLPAASPSPRDETFLMTCFMVFPNFFSPFGSLDALQAINAAKLIF